VLDARDPLGSRAEAVEEIIMRKPDKKIVFVLNKVRRLLHSRPSQRISRYPFQPVSIAPSVDLLRACGSHLSPSGCESGTRQVDLVPKQVVADWLAYLRRFHPTIAFKAATQVRPLACPNLICSPITCFKIEGHLAWASL
jgi:hypothetical protein